MGNPAKRNEGLVSKLWNLANFIREHAFEAKAQNKLVQISQTYVRTKTTNFECKEGGVRTHGWATEYFEKPEWHWKHQHEFIQTTLKNAPNFKECFEALKKEFGQTGRLDNGLNQFATKIAFAAIEGLSDAEMAEIVSRFIGDFNKAPINNHVLIWADGLWLKDDKISLPNIILRRPTQEAPSGATYLQIPGPMNLLAPSGRHLLMLRR